ncbi:hypothetical protein SAMN04515674_103398 [Pseudarcicella hirudinis]|uniref:Uncharacterized protein n=1 Tax=Pseudarcicella hirudinis TaxID=1079859 RepID=A0A1I5QW52_9BACT|nr:hypothetical protein SAMN04515674_103398 [Pseudarcicella hirudinis]
MKVNKKLAKRVMIVVALIGGIVTMSSIFNESSANRAANCLWDGCECPTNDLGNCMCG